MIPESAAPAAPAPLLAPYDALVLLSFGGPEGPDDVVPFLENVTRGRGIPRERLVEVGEHYFAFGGRSPINEQNLELLAALRAELAARGAGDLPVHWGNRNWDPYLTDALREAHEAGARRVLVLTTSAYASYSGCRQYREDVAASLIALAGEGRRLLADKVRHYFNAPGFVQANTDAVLAALAELDDDVRDGAHLVFTTHSIPDAMAAAAGPDGHAYERQHESVVAEVTRRVAEVTGVEHPSALVYCSRSGPPTQPWLEPDVNDHLTALRERGAASAVVAPIGFISDHMEVKYDLDTEAAETAAEIGLPFARAATAGVHTAFVTALVDLVLERAAAERGEGPQRAATGSLGPSHDVCPVGCCANLRAPDRPAACGLDWVDPPTSAPATATAP
nr:ferrochelatase [Quadrisphaera sp. INWT6]